jgi:hypothetical protein
MNQRKEQRVCTKFCANLGKRATKNPRNDSTRLRGPNLESCSGVSMACPVQDRSRSKNGGDGGTGVYVREGTTSRVMAADRPYGKFYDFYSVSLETFGSTLVCCHVNCTLVYEHIICVGFWLRILALCVFVWYVSHTVEIITYLSQVAVLCSDGAT